MMMDLAPNVGEAIIVDVQGGDFVRARVWLDVRKELRRFVTIKPEGEAIVVMRVKYKKNPRYCDVCGRMGHVKEECSSREHCPGKEGFGKWLLADAAPERG
jgi:hypothetical protein